ncbi:nucleotide exchange factor GrpE [Synechococcus sp. Nb3U1]|uniref:nucleotide exchange factor GrpE n=1 Tax=Synechococcus sp. Nb3U1 TaxID=1914529 RepID=UPI001F22B231|nr:nucleotide exchange factor GrpE [Synechococcus sp. Nb3U1]MCF2969669.1 nucleotide exchange factor GrpE [Synechococcus sp. Nb3U1]
MTSEEKQPMAPEDAYPELQEEEIDVEAELEKLILEDSEAETGATPGETSAEPTLAQSEALKQLQHELEVIRQQSKEKEESYLRLYADFENYRRRTQREKEEFSQKERQKFVLEILPVVDSFERAQQQVKLETDRERELHNSYQSVYRLLVESLKKMGVSRMKAVGQPFDPNLHEAIARQPSSEHPEDVVVTEYQAGYKLGDLVIRHAMVAVSEGSPEAEATAHEGIPAQESSTPEASPEPETSLPPENE